MKFKSGLASVVKPRSTLGVLINDILGPLLSIIIESLCVLLLNLSGVTCCTVKNGKGTVTTVCFRFIRPSS